VHEALRLGLSIGICALGTNVAWAQGYNPDNLGVMLRSPFAGASQTFDNYPGGCTSAAGDTNCCAPNHWRPWGGDWSCDLRDTENTCGQAAFAKLSPTMGLPNASTGAPAGVVPERLRVVVAEQGFACASHVYGDGGVYQKFNVFATYRGREVLLGWVLYAHLANDDTNGRPRYNVGDEITADGYKDAANVYVGTVYCANHTSGCWGGIGHVHLEVYTASANNGACYALAAPQGGIPAFGTDSVIGKLGMREQGGGHPCPAVSNDESRSCSTWDQDQVGCDAHAYGVTQDCAYYWCSEHCRARGTSNCEAGCTGTPGDPTNYCTTEPEFCSTWDENLSGCDAHQYGTTRDCAYYVDSNKCKARGTSNCEAGISSDCQLSSSSCRAHDGDVAGCDATPGCAYYYCSDQCHPAGPRTARQAARSSVGRLEQGPFVGEDPSGNDTNAPGGTDQ
jgi:hypothetical protein